MFFTAEREGVFEDVYDGNLAQFVVSRCIWLKPRRPKECRQTDLSNAKVVFCTIHSLKFACLGVLIDAFEEKLVLSNPCSGIGRKMDVYSSWSTAYSRLRVF